MHLEVGVHRGGTVSKGLTQHISSEPRNINPPHFLITAEPFLPSHEHAPQLGNFFFFLNAKM